MSKIFRFVVIISIFYVISVFVIDRCVADTKGNSDASNIGTIKPPTGLIGKQELVSVDLFWSNSSSFKSRVDGYLVYYWQTDQGILNIKQASQDIIKVQNYKVENLLPNTEYSFIVRSATTNESDSLEKYNDYYLSSFSKEYKIRTKSDLEMKLLMSNINGGLIEVKKYVTHKQEWFEQVFFVNLGNEIGEVKRVDDLEIDFRTGFILQDVRTKTIDKVEVESNTFVDPRDSSIKIKVTNNKNELTGVILEAVLIDSGGTKIILQKQN